MNVVNVYSIIIAINVKPTSVILPLPPLPPGVTMSRIIISALRVSRELPQPFAMCGDSDTMIRIAEEIFRQARALEYTGWIRVDISHPSDAPPNTPPKEWVE